MSQHFDRPGSHDDRPEGTPVAAAESEIAASMAHAAAFIHQFSQVARAESCVGPEQTRNGHTVIPLATVSVQAGFGMGFGGGSDATSRSQGSGGAVGGGGRGASRVIAVVHISEAGISVKPVFDVTSILLALMALIGISTVVGRGRTGPKFRRSRGRGG